jgi:pilus assembly protein Flp/PilA
MVDPRGAPSEQWSFGSGGDLVIVDRTLSTFERSGFLATHAQNKGESFMARLIAVAKKFATEEEGASLVEYALLVALLAAASIIILIQIGLNIQAKFTNVNAALS